MRALNVLFFIAITGAVITLVIRFMPAEIKISGLAAIRELVPSSWNKQIESLTLTPREKRAQIIHDLSAKLDALNNRELSDTERSGLINDSKTLINKFTAANNHGSIAETVAAKIAEGIIGGKRENCADQNNSVR